MEQTELCDRVYLPSASNGIDIKEYLLKYIEHEFPEKPGHNVVYSIPRTFNWCGEKQARLAEQTVFSRLKSLRKNAKLEDMWMIFIHNVTYAGHSNRNLRLGKLIIREHDFVIFVKHQGKNHVVLVEVKSTNDNNTDVPDVSVRSDAKVIKNNKRTAQHQLRDHLEVLQRLLGSENSIQQYIFWPFLGATTKDPKHVIINRWKEDDNLHVFENVLSKQDLFDEWFERNIFNGPTISDIGFTNLLNRFLILGCGFLVDEIRTGLLALLTQEQVQLLHSDVCQNEGKSIVVHGAAGTGKTLLIIRKLEQLYHAGKLDDNNRALYICYWPGIRAEVEDKLRKLNIKDYVDTARFYVSQTGFLSGNKNKYKHIFMDEAEVICLTFSEEIMREVFVKIQEKYEAGNANSAERGELWYLMDTNQTSILRLKNSPTALEQPNIVLSKVMRSTRNIFKLFKQFYNNPGMVLNEIKIGHGVMGPPITWVDALDNSLVEVVIDLCGCKGFKPNDICVLPFIVSDAHTQCHINASIDEYFVDNAFRPRCIVDVEKFVCKGQVDEFLVAWGLRVKGLEFKVVIIVIDIDDFDVMNMEDRKRMYIMLSRCTCMLILVCPKNNKDEIDSDGSIQTYIFGDNL